MRRRVVLAIALVAAASVALFALPLGLALQRTYRDDERLRLQRDTVAATRQIDIGNGRDRVELPSSSDRLGVYDIAGRLVAGRPTSGGAALVRGALRTGRSFDGEGAGRLLTVVPLLSRERVGGALLASRSDGAIAARTHRAWWRLLALAAAVVLLAVLAATVLGRRLAIPLERLAAVARRLGEGDFSIRSPRGPVPELDALGQALDATARRLDELVTRERAFSADASHQLRTPLAALRIELEAMQMAGAEAPEVERAIGEVDRLQATIDALLAVARDSPRGEGTTDVGTLLDEVEEAWRPRLAERARPLHVFSHDGSISAAPAVVRQIFDVLLDNALRHGAGAVEVRCRPTGRFVAIEVHDEGNATPVPESVFARRGPEAADGHGIGLALARSLAHAEGGRLALRSDAGGTTFTLTMNTAAGV